MQNSAAKQPNPGYSPNSLESQLNTAYQTYKSQNKVDATNLVMLGQLRDAYLGKLSDNAYGSAVSAIGALMGQKDKLDSSVCSLVEQMSKIYDSHAGNDKTTQKLQDARNSAITVLYETAGVKREQPAEAKREQYVKPVQPRVKETYTPKETEGATVTPITAARKYQTPASKVKGEPTEPPMVSPAYIGEASQPAAETRPVNYRATQPGVSTKGAIVEKNTSDVKPSDLGEVVKDTSVESKPGSGGIFRKLGRGGLARVGLYLMAAAELLTFTGMMSCNKEKADKPVPAAVAPAPQYKEDAMLSELYRFIGREDTKVVKDNDGKGGFVYKLANGEGNAVELQPLKDHPGVYQYLVNVKVAEGKTEKKPAAEIVVIGNNGKPTGNDQGKALVQIIDDSTVWHSPSQNELRFLITPKTENDKKEHYYANIRGMLIDDDSPLHKSLLQKYMEARKTANLADVLFIEVFYNGVEEPLVKKIDADLSSLVPKRCGGHWRFEGTDANNNPITMVRIVYYDGTNTEVLYQPNSLATAVNHRACAHRKPDKDKRKKIMPPSVVINQEAPKVNGELGFTAPQDDSAGALGFNAPGQGQNGELGFTPRSN